MSHLLTLLSALFFGAQLASAHSTARWNVQTTDWTKNPHPQIGDWGFNRPGYPKGLYIHGITVKEGEKVKNAVIYDNDVFNDVFEDEWMFCMSSLGLMNLKALIITPVLTDGWGFYHPDWVKTGTDACALAAASGMRNIPSITVGTIAGNEKEGEGKDSPAARLYVDLINSEYTKHPDLPVIVNIGGQAASLASAYCIDPSIAEKCIVYYTDLKVYNGHYEWASKLVAKNFRVVNWGADEHWWKGKKGENEWRVLPRPEKKLGRNNNEDSGEWKLLHDMHQPILDNMIRDMQHRREYAEDFADGYCDGTFIHAWLPGIFTGAKIQELRGEGTEGIHVTGFDEHCEELVKQFTMSILLNPKAYGKKLKVQKTGNMPEHISVSSNHRYLVDEQGEPFFYLADTAWELFHRLNREEADTYLNDRAQKGFTAIQAVAIAELDGISTPNAYGHLPFVDEDPTRPAVVEGADNDYWDHVDFIVRKANEKGLYIAMLPTWGRYWHDGKRPVFNARNARIYGRWLAGRYRDAKVIWVLGGDRNPENDNHREVIRQMAQGLIEGDQHTHLITYHPTGLCGSAQFFHGEEWLDFNMRQNGHNHWAEAYKMTRDDWNRSDPVKPVLDGEPIYEDHPVAFDAGKRGHSVAADCRRALYWDLFNGACGHTYGHHSVWQMWNPDKSPYPVNNPLLPWHEAINQPASAQMQWGKKLILSRPYLTRIPATELVLAESNIPSAWPGEGIYRFVATMDTDGTYLMVYAPVGRRFEVNTTVIKADKLTGWWYNPRNGKSEKIGPVERAERVSFISPNPGEELDWVLVIDDASKKYRRP